jgi:hypothetical protein
MADQDQGPAFRHIALALVVDLGDQRAGGVEHRQAARRGFLLHTARHAVGAEDSDRKRRHLGEILDEDGALVLQAFDHVLVVDDLVADIDRRAIFLERALDDLDRPHHARAKASRLRQIHFHGSPVTQVAPHSFRIPGPVSQLRYLQYLHHGECPQPSTPAKRMEGRGFVSKNHRREKAKPQMIASIQAPRSGNIIQYSPKPSRMNPHIPHLFVT